MLLPSPPGAATSPWFEKQARVFAWLLAATPITELQPAGEAVFPALAPGGPHGVRAIRRVEAVGSAAPLKFTQDGTGLRVAPPPQPGPHTAVFKVLGA